MKKIIILSLLIIGNWTCKKKEHDFPITTTFDGAIEKQPIQIYTKDNFQIVPVSPDQTHLDEAKQWDFIYENGIFGYIRFDSKLDAVYTLHQSFNPTPTEMRFNYAYENGKLFFDTDFGDPTVSEGIIIDGEPTDFTIASEGIIIQNNSGVISHWPNFRQLGINFYAGFLENGDTILIQKYLQHYTQ